MVRPPVISRVPRRALLWVGLCIASGTASAQTPDVDPVLAVRLAKSAFEYRDFDRVVALLTPWLHPPRIADPALQVQARELLGVSQHVLGNTAAAEEEFAQLLEQAPRHELDPFLVPPPVVQSFEEVRAKMKPILDKLIAEPTATTGTPPAEVRTETRTIEVMHASLALAPLGVPQFVLGETGWGAMWASLQVLSLGVNVLGWAQSRRATTRQGWRTWQIVQYSGLAGLAGAWAGSGIHGYQLLMAQRAGLVAPRAPPPAQSGAVSYSFGLTWRGRF